MENSFYSSYIDSTPLIFPPAYHHLRFILEMVAKLLKTLCRPKVSHFEAGRSVRAKISTITAEIFKSFACFRRSYGFRIPEAALRSAGLLSIERIKQRRLEKASLRNNSFIVDFNDIKTVRRDDFDFVGIRWMQAGLWGHNHPIENIFDLVWTLPSPLETYYDNIEMNEPTECMEVDI